MYKSINIKEAKKILENIIQTSGNEKTNELILILCFLYHNAELQENSNKWIKSIENKFILPQDIINSDKFNIFYPAENTRSKNYRYYINSLGIMAVVKTNGEYIKKYNYKEKTCDCHIIPINNNGCLDGEKFNKNSQLPFYIGNLSIYKQIIKTELYKHEKNYIAHHIICNCPNDKTQKNDARDNRTDNIIEIPKHIHQYAHKKLDKNEKKEAENLYNKYKETL